MFRVANPISMEFQKGQVNVVVQLFKRRTSTFFKRRGSSFKRHAG